LYDASERLQRSQLFLEGKRSIYLQVLHFSWTG